MTHLVDRLVGAAGEHPVEELGHLAGLEVHGAEVGHRGGLVLERPRVVELEVGLLHARNESGEFLAPSRSDQSARTSPLLSPMSL